jgi:hypothetical protein
VVFIAYGAIEALQGEAGLPRFNEGLNKLLDKVGQLGAKAILLSPMPLMSASSPEELAKRNAMLELYGAAIASTAAARHTRFIDIYKPLLARSQQVKLSDNGFHLNETGYYYLAATIEKALGLAPRQESVVIRLAKNDAAATAPAKMVDSGKQDGSLQFTLGEEYLPLPLPGSGEGIPDKGPILQITGLKKGFYTLSAGGSQVITASANQWKEGVEIRHGASLSQVRALQEKIIKKNDLFFQQYRPQNKTYILGFRSYEQGRHAKDLEDLSFIITWLEGQIALTRMPKSTLYQLSPLK